MNSVVLSSKFQLVIPKAVREDMNIHAGQEFILIPKGNTLQLVPKLALSDITGMLAKANIKDIRDRSDRV